jgi:hypothetical protein
MTLLPSHDLGTIILAELPNSFAIAVISEGLLWLWRVRRMGLLGSTTINRMVEKTTQTLLFLTICIHYKLALVVILDIETSDGDLTYPKGS